MNKSKLLDVLCKKLCTAYEASLDENGLPVVDEVTGNLAEAIEIIHQNQ